MRFPNDEDGQGIVEYALILILVAIVVIAILTLLQPQLESFISQFLEWFESTIG